MNLLRGEITVSCFINLPASIAPSRRVHDFSRSARLEAEAALIPLGIEIPARSRSTRLPEFLERLSSESKLWGSLNAPGSPVTSLCLEKKARMHKREGEIEGKKYEWGAEKGGKGGAKGDT